MFSTSGYFRAISCPFYVNGLCERPYCHFRHTKQDNEKSKDDAPNYSTAGVRCTSPVDGAGGINPYSGQQSGSIDSYFTSTESSVAQASASKSSTELLLAEIGESFSIPSFTDPSARYSIPSASEEPEQYLTASPKTDDSKTEKTSNSSKYPLPEGSEDVPLPTYCPTPKTPSFPPAKSSEPASGIPDYQPTPKRELKRRSGDHRRIADLEYDPEINFSCGGLSKDHSPTEEPEYRPTQKKAKVVGQRKRLSCDSLVGFGPDGEFINDGGDDDSDDDDGPPDGEFSEDEPEPEPFQEKMEESEEFENIGDDDISSDDEFVDVPHPPVPASSDVDSSSAKVNKHSSGGTTDLKSTASAKTHKSSKKKDSSHSNSSKKSLDISSTKSTDKKSHSSGSLKSQSSEKSKSVTDRRHSSSSPSSVHKKASSSFSSSKEHSSKQSGKSSSSKHSSSKEKHSSSKTADRSKPKSDSMVSKTPSLIKKAHSSDSTISSSKTSKTPLHWKRSTDSKQSSHGNHSSSSHHSGSSNKGSSHSHKSSNDSKTKSGDSGKQTPQRKLSKSEEYSENGGFLGSMQTKLVEPLESKPSKSGSEPKKDLNLVKQKNSSDKSKNKPDSSSHKKSVQKKQKIDPNGSGMVQVMRMNSDLFGDDSDDENIGGVEPSEPTTSASADIDYGSFIHDSDFEDEDTFDECLRIFRENAAQLGSPALQEKKLVKDMKPKTEAGPKQGVGKKRIAHSPADQARKLESLKKERPRQHLSPAQVMHNRIMEMQRRALERATKQAVQEQEVSSTSGSTPRSASTSGSGSKGQGQGGEKKRVAHVPKPVTPAPSESAGRTVTMVKKGEKMVTIASTASKTEKRVAHTPNLSNLKRPVIPASFGSKVASNIRQRYLNLIIDECLKFCASEEAAYKKALEEENGVYERSTNKNIYLRVAVNTITRLRSEAKETSHPSSSTSPPQRRPSLTQSHQALLGGSRAAKTSFTLHRSSSSGKKTEVALTGAELYQKLLKYSLTEEQLAENGYPRSCPDEPGKAVCLGKKYQETDTLLKSNERTCARCGTRFIVNGNGTYLNQEECVYHWTRAYPRKRSGFIQHIYNCCNSDTSSKGCQIASNHVHEKNKQEMLTGFQRTMPCSPPPDDNYGAHALDCEMVYTLGGIELARVTVVDIEGKTVFESLVKPLNPIVDYNTRFSGLTAADLKDVTTTLTDIQAILLSMFSDKTILIGHSLESDLCALKLIHSTVVDTSVVFPHRLGPPYKRALKNLILETFQKIIQCDDGGHDSKEDAVACLDLMKWRIKEDSRRENRYS